MYTAIVIRPGETDFDREERIQGSLDLPLNSNGWRQVSEIIERLKDEKPDVIFTSPSEPSRSTAEMLSDALGVPLKELDGLANMDQGLWQGMLLADLRRKHPRVYRQWHDSPDSVCPPAGETYAAASERVEKALRRPMKKGGTFAVVASEPVASLVSCIVQGTVPPVPASPCCTSRPAVVEVIEPHAATAS